MPSLSRIVLALALFAALLLPPPARAQSAVDAFQVKGIDVDVTAANVSAAKEQAIADGQRQAFRILLERITVASDHGRLPKVDGTQYVRDFAIDQERSSSVRYIAALSVRFNAAAVKKLLRDAGISYAEVRARTVVMVPVLKIAGRALLWDDPNPWRAAWTAQSGNGLVPLTVPSGELADVQAITAEQALAGDSQHLQMLGARFRTGEVMVVTGTLTNEGRRLEVALSATAGAPKPFDSVAYTATEGETADALMARAVRDVARAIDTVYKQPNMLHFDRSATLSALAPLSGLDDWLAVRERLGRVSQVRGYEVVSLSRAEAALVLHVVGDPEEVRAALGRAGLGLEWSDGYWTMRPAAAQR